ncbi:hypothetical protein BH20ACT15_BH20ACT15_09040 [soil metagenome]
MRRALLCLLLALLFALAACGDDETTTVTEELTVTAGESEPETAAATETETSADGPSGELSTAGVGPIERGATTAEVTEAFGEPDEQIEAVGCELAGPNAPRVLTWTWELGDGEFSLVFDAKSATLNSYRTDSAELATVRGDRVGDPFASLKANWGAELERLSLGAKSTAKRGFWWVRDNQRAELLFDIRGGVIKRIEGADVQVCE